MMYTKKIIKTLFPIFIIMAIAFSLTPNVSGATTDFQFEDTMYIITGKTFVDTSKVNILVGENFWVWHSYKSIDIKYSSVNQTFMDGNYKSSLVNIMMVDGARLTISQNGTVIFDGITHAKNFENSLKYELGFYWDNYIVNVFIGFFIAFLYVLNKWLNVDKPVLGGYDEESQIKN